MGVALRMRYGLIRLVELYQKESSFVFLDATPTQGWVSRDKTLCQRMMGGLKTKVEKAAETVVFSFIYKYQNLTQILVLRKKFIRIDLLS
jgi:hypothetical protein